MNNALGVAAGNTGGGTEVAVRLASLDGAAEEHSVGTSGAEGGQLIEGQGLATVLHDASASSLREAKSGNLDVLREGEETLVIGNATNNNGDLLAQILALGVADDLSNRDGSAVNAAHAEAVKDDLVELAASAAGKEAVELQRS